jgi:hypothetical protein
MSFGHVQGATWRDQVREHPILLAFAAVWALEAGMNILYGYRRGGGGIGAGGYAAVFGAIAFIAAWLPTRIRYIHPQDQMAAAKRFVFVALTLLCVSLSQVAGWSVMGVTLADGQAARDDQATKRSTARERLDLMRAEMRKLGVQPPVDQVQARMDAELATVVNRRTGETVADASNSCAIPSGAPAPCQRYAKLKAELATAKRYAELESKIQSAGGAIDSSPAVAEGSPDVAVLARITGADEKDVRFWFTVVLVAIIGLFANLGFAIVGLGSSQPHDFANYSGSGQWQHPEPYPHGAPLLPAPSGAMAPPQHYTHAAPQPASASPIHLHLGAATGYAPTHPAIAAPGPAPHPAVGIPSPRVPDEAPPKQSRAEPLPSSPAPDRPVDRNRLRELLDGLLAFEAATLTKQDGAAISAADLYARYAASAGQRAVAPEAFHTMFSAATNVSQTQIAGIPHYMDVAFKAAQLRAVH